ncbi:MAG TPA: phage holin family protein [Woeseiaceae bacterium]|nr:phage holin family protein [Woeseiaceae bacterium]
MQQTGDTGLGDRAGTAAKEPTNVLALTTAWLSSVRGRFQVVTELAFAEASLAATSLGLIACMTVFAIVFVLIAWGLLAAAMAAGLVNIGLPLWGAVLLLAALHLAAASALLWKILRLSEHLKFAATRAQLRRQPELPE